MLRRRSFRFFLFLLATICASPAQTFVFQPHLFGPNLFSGGIDTPRYQFVDIDGDNDQDLFILDRDELLWFYRKQGNTLLLEPLQTFGLSAGSWFRFADIDRDGDQDCFTNGEFSEVTLFINTGTPQQPHFEQHIAAMKDTAGNEMFSERFSIPAFADIDGDGDQDFFSGSQSGSVTFYRNVGSSAVPAFAFVTSEFDGIKIVGGGLMKAKHGASGIEFFDADSNGTLDLFWGDYFNPSIYALKNIGSSTAPNFVLTDSTYPKEHPVATFGFNIPQHVDFDRDGIVDLMTGTVFPTEGYDNLWFYKNVGTNASPFYSLQTKNLVPMIDAGGRSTIAPADYDGDGDIDFCLSSGGGEIRIYKNDGTPKMAQFSGSHSIVATLPSYYVSISAGDVNGDGKPDLLAGDFNGGIRFLKNKSTAGLISFSPQIFPLDTVDTGNSSAPCIADADQDGLTDVLIGNSGGTLSFYKNSGTDSNPVYMLITSKFGNIDVGNDAVPFVCDIDGDGRKDLFVGNRDGTMFRFEFDPVNAGYAMVTGRFADINIRINAAPAFADINDDGDLDLLLGNGKGGIYFYENTTVSSTGNEMGRIPLQCELFQNYPNPFNPVTTFSFDLPVDALVDLTVYSILGSEIDVVIHSALPSGRHSVSWNASPFSSGTYFYRLTVLSNGQQQAVLTRPMVYLK